MNSSFTYQIYSVRKIMFLVLIACIPAIFTKYYFFGSGSLIQILFSIITALVLEVIILKIRAKKIKISLQDNSSIVIAVLFSLSIPCLIPWWLIITGLFFSIIITKHLYGGIGQNIFNPAMIGYAVLLASFPIYMNNWNERDVSLSFSNDIKKSINFIFFQNYTHDVNGIDSNINFDAVTGATPLNDFKIKSHTVSDILSGEYPVKNKKINIKTSWKYMNISFLLGGLFLLFKRVICWRIPISFLSALSLLSIITYYYSKEAFMSPLVHLFSGGTMMCAFFISTDPVTTSCTRIGKILFGIMIGFLVWIIRNYSDYPDAIAFSVLFGNMTVPLIDHYINTSGYGHDK